MQKGVTYIYVIQLVDTWRVMPTIPLEQKHSKKDEEHLESIIEMICHNVN